MNRQTPSPMVYGESGKKPLTIKIQIRMINFWVRIVFGDDNKIVFKIYKLIRHLHDSGIYTSPWIGKINDVFNSCGMTNVWRNPYNFNPEWIKKSLALRLNDMYEQNWHSNINEMNSCITYKLIKRELKLEKYLLQLNRHERINLCKFRCRNSKIPIITQGYAYLNIPRENRICNICDLDEVGDEYHYIMRCSYFEDNRIKHINSYFWSNPNLSKFSELFLSNEMEVLSNLSKFITIVLKKFR